MTDKQIIGGRGSAKSFTTLNTVEVLLENEKLKEALKRKEQECERLEYELILKDVANIELSDEVKKYRKAIDEIEEIADNNYEIAEMEQIFLIIGGLDV